MSCLLVTICGISLLQNAIPPGKRCKLYALANSRTDTLSSQEDQLFQEWQRAAEQRLNACDYLEARKLSAELNGLLSWLDENDVKVHHHLLLVTDTHAGAIVGELLRQWMTSQGMQVQVRPIRDLATRNLEEFQLALSDLAKMLMEELLGWRHSGYRIVFNLTAGFKSINGFLQTLGIALADECFYIFETGEELLRIPRLPVSFVPEKSIFDHLDTIRRLAHGYPVSREASNRVPDTLLFRSGNEVTLSPWGEALWAQLQSEIYKSELHPPLSRRIRYSHSFERDAAELQPLLRAQLNRRIDQLSRYMDGHSDGANLAGLNFHRLNGDPKPPSTHEFYVTSGGGAQRAFGHFEGKTFVLDSVSGHL